MWQSKTFLDSSFFGNEDELRKAVCQFLNDNKLSVNDVKISEYETSVGGHHLVITVYWQERTITVSRRPI